MTMMPRSLSDVAGVVEAMCGRTWRIRSMVPRTLTFMTKSKSSREKGLRLRSMIWRLLELIQKLYGILGRNLNFDFK